jgi:hypothetical protein
LSLATVITLTLFPEFSTSSPPSAKLPEPRFI